MQVHETTKAMPYELVFGQPPRSIIILEPRLKGTIDEEQLDEKDDDITDDEVVKEEKECNSDESSTEDIKQETYNEEGKNELLKFEMSMQQQVKQQLTDPHNHNLLFVQFREMSLYAANTQEELAEDAEDSREPTGLEETHSESLFPRSLPTQKKHLEIHIRKQMLHT